MVAFGSGGKVVELLVVGVEGEVVVVGPFVLVSGCENPIVVVGRWSEYGWLFGRWVRVMETVGYGKGEG